MDHRKPTLYDYRHNDCFCDPANWDAINAPMPGYDDWLRLKETTKIPDDTPIELVHAYQWPLLTGEQERHLFRKLNLHKYIYNKLVQTEPALSAAKLCRLANLESEANIVREAESILFSCNVRLVISLVKYRTTHAGFWNALSEGNFALLNCISKFDYAHLSYNKNTQALGPVKFSTYATYGINRLIYRYNDVEFAYFNHHASGTDDWLLKVPDPHGESEDEVDEADDRRQFQRLMGLLNKREQQIVRLRYGMGGRSPQGAEVWTLREIGKQLGITRERVRQIEAKAMRRLFIAARTTPIEAPTVLPRRRPKRTANRKQRIMD